MIRTLSWLLVLTFIAPVTFAQDIGTWEKVLLPVVASTEVEGVNGARFGTAISAIAVDGTVPYFPVYAVEGAALGPPRFGTLAPEKVTPLFLLTSYSRSGRLLYLDPASAGHLTLAAYLYSRSGSGDVYQETAVPVVRSDRFLTSTANILGVRSSYRYADRPNSTCRNASPQFRHALRIYDVDGRGDAVVRVRIYTEDGLESTLRQETTVMLSRREGDDATYPAFAEMAMDEFCRPFSCAIPCAGGMERVEISPLSPGLRFWAVVSATDNVTQQVSLAFPQ